VACPEGQLDRGCRIGYFSLETTTQSNLSRERLGAIFREWLGPFDSCITPSKVFPLVSR
jgi:TetR/AcrR family transcriptional repressor of nem operon